MMCTTLHRVRRYSPDQKCQALPSISARPSYKSRRPSSNRPMFATTTGSNSTSRRDCDQDEVLYTDAECGGSALQTLYLHSVESGFAATF